MTLQRLLGDGFVKNLTKQLLFEKQRMTFRTIFLGSFSCAFFGDKRVAQYFTNHKNINILQREKQLN